MDLKVMIVDDSSALRRYLSASLNELGLKKVIQVDRATKALEILRNDIDGYDLLMIDLHMPGMDGLELLQELSKISFRGAIAIISALEQKVISFAAEIAQEERLKVIGSIRKPISQVQVKTLLDRTVLSMATETDELTCLTPKEVITATRNGQLIPYFQPIVSGVNGEIRILEALARIDKPGHTSAITPKQFLHVAESNSLMMDITEVLLDRALADYSTFIAHYPTKNIKLSINVPPELLLRKDLPNNFLNLVIKHGVNPHQIIVEVTERTAIENSTQFGTLNRLRIQGFGVALDDYGTGFTNLNQLKDFPFTEIKLDRSLIHHISDDRLLQIISDSIASITRQEKLSLVAEGIDNLMDLQFLICLNPILLQGYLICRPKPIESILTWAHSWNRQNPLKKAASGQIH